LDQNSIGEKNQLGEGPLDARDQAAAPNTALAPPFAFPRLRHVHRIDEAHEGSRNSDGPGDVARSIQQIDASNNSRRAWETPLPPNTFEFCTGNSARIDAFRHVRLADIITRDRLRGVAEALVPIMTDSVSELDVIQPPVVRPDPSDGDKFILVSGLQRINAATVLGKRTMLCRVVALNEFEAALWEVDENLVRASLGPADEALFMARRREVYELLHGKGKARGAAAANAKMGRRHAAAMLARASFSEDTAHRTGKSRRYIQRAIQRAAQNGPTTLTRIARTALDTGAELDALPLLPRATQERLIEQAAAGAEVSAVRARREMRESSAAEGLDTTEALSQPDSIEAEIDFPGLSALKKAWLGASSSARENFLAWIEALT
jgi:ParB-like chromosome segregation protein Spo0J